MRQPPPLILGAGLAGCAAAIALGRAGAAPILLDRDENVGDPLCGGFLSWRTAAQLDEMGVRLAQMGAHRVETLAIFAHGQEATIPLPAPAWGLSRHALDTAMRAAAIAAGADFAVDTIRQMEGGRAIGHKREWTGSGIFLASGKHDIRGTSRPRKSGDPALGLRIRLPATAERTALVGGRIELHLFDGGYAGLVLQEGGSANLCLAIRKSRFASAGGGIEGLLDKLAADNPALALRLGSDWRHLAHDTVGAVPYGFIARPSVDTLFRLGDQAAVIPSLAGEGMGIALASGTAAAAHWLRHGPDSAATFQRDFASRAAKPVRLASLAWHLAENGTGQRLALIAARHLPASLDVLMQRTRVERPALPCASGSPC